MSDDRGDRTDPIEAMDVLLGRFEADEKVAYAEVCGVSQDRTDLVVTDEGPRDTVSFTERGVWCRVFVDGAGDYRYTTSLDDESLDDVAERAIRAADVLAQDEPARFDAHSTHRGVHGGWAREGVDAVDPETKTAVVEEGLSAADDLDLRQAWINYADAHIESTLGTTTGSTLRTTLDRASATCILTPEEGPKVSRHAGSTRGAAFLENLPEALEDAAADVRALAAASEADAPTGEASVLLSPRAAGQLIQFVSRYVEADTAHMELSPYSVGDRIGPEALTIEDGVRAGSWTARAYDAEARPTTPVGLIENGRVARLLHNTASAADAETYPAGNAIPSLGFDQPPRIHARHLAVAPGDATRAELREGADVLVDRFDEPWLRDEFERIQRSGFMPASVPYAKDIGHKIGTRSNPGRADLPIAEGYSLADGERAGRVEGVSLAYDPATLREVTAIGAARSTVTGITEKHKSWLPYAVTAPAIRLRAMLQPNE